MERLLKLPNCKMSCSFCCQEMSSLCPSGVLLRSQRERAKRNMKIVNKRESLCCERSSSVFLFGISLILFAFSTDIINFLPPNTRVIVILRSLTLKRKATLVSLFFFAPFGSTRFNQLQLHSNCDCLWRTFDLQLLVNPAGFPFDC